MIARICLSSFLALATTTGAARAARPAVAESVGPPASVEADSGLSGHWEGNMTDESKIFAITFDFQVKGSAFTGTLEVPSLDRVVAFTNGTITGNRIAFKGFGKWTGTLAGDQLTLTRELDYGKKQHMTAHRVAKPKAK